MKKNLLRGGAFPRICSRKTGPERKLCPDTKNHLFSGENRWFYPYQN